MNNADLAEIRALLRENAPPERPARKWLPSGLSALLGGSPGSGPKARAQPPPARRVGLRPAKSAEVEPAADEPGADEAAASAEARRLAFGQKHDPAAATTPPLLLLSRAPPETELVPLDAMELILRRRARSLLQPVSPPWERLPEPADTTLDATLHGAPHETPYHPEDLFDPAGADAQEVYDASGLFEPRVPDPPAPVEIDPERELLAHLERVFRAEQAALLARRI